MGKKTISARELMKQWNMNSIDFVDFVANNLPKLYPIGNSAPFLVPYNNETLQTINFNLFESTTGRVRILKGIDSVYFFVDDVRRFEDHNKPAKETKLQKQKRLARQEAQTLWQKDPTITIADMTMQNVSGKDYGERTVRNWIKDLAPNRNPGRRKKR